MGSTEWLSITYRDFYDLPRAFFVWCNGRWLYALSTFDEVMSDYGDYQLYDMGSQGPDSHSGSWVNLEQGATARLGDLRLTADSFDDTRRSLIRDSALRHIG